ncbi:MAG: alpha/beta fold hydrolase [Planctomycetota bacterium]|nr:MAG: alpha/beta fold hydrolase [Planctomycetota bacterium]
MSDESASLTIETTGWSIPGAGGEPLLVSTDRRAGLTTPASAVLLAHGFKGYKDYGFIPVLSRRLAGRLPIVVHRFNFSHSGMTEEIATFARPDLFERDTWNKQVADLDALMGAIEAGRAPATPARTPIVLMGHSRGGVSCLLCAGRRARDGRPPAPAAVVTISAPAECCSLDERAKAELRQRGHLESPSSRTGQTLRIGRAWLDEQEADPAGHDLAALASRIEAPVLVVHGDADPTVDPACADRIASACPRGRVRLIPGADHVFNTPNPADLEAAPSAQLAELIDHIAGFLGPIACRSG